MKCRHLYAEERHTAAMWTSISKGQIPRRLLRFFQSKRTSVWTRVDTSELAPKRPLSSTWYKVYNSYKCFISVMKCIGAGFASYKGEKASSTTEYASLGLGGLSLIGALHRYAE